MGPAGPCSSARIRAPATMTTGRRRRRPISSISAKRAAGTPGAQLLQPAAARGRLASRIAQQRSGAGRAFAAAAVAADRSGGAALPADSGDLAPPALGIGGPPRLEKAPVVLERDVRRARRGHPQRPRPSLRALCAAASRPDSRSARARASSSSAPAGGKLHGRSKDTPNSEYARFDRIRAAEADAEPRRPTGGSSSRVDDRDHRRRRATGQPARHVMEISLTLTEDERHACRRAAVLLRALAGGLREIGTRQEADACAGVCGDARRDRRQRRVLRRQQRRQGRRRAGGVHPRRDPRRARQCRSRRGSRLRPAATSSD